MAHSTPSVPIAAATAVGVYANSDLPAALFLFMIALRWRSAS
jgi:hypothetical protein